MDDCTDNISVAVEEAVRRELDLKVLQDTGIRGGGCVSAGAAYDTDKHGRVFIKVNEKSWAKTMFTGEYESLTALYAPDIVRVPKPIQVVDLGKGRAAFVMEYLEMGRGLSKHAATLGEQHARLKLHNSLQKEKSQQAESSVHKNVDGPVYVGRFGFHVNTCCGYLEMNNTWRDDWPSFYADKLDVQVRMLEKKGERQPIELWNQILPRLPRFFKGIEVEPALVHGDLYSGNVAENSQGPVIYDPASYYGHHEYDLAIGYLFGGFNSKYYDSRRNLIYDPASYYGHHEYDLAIGYLFGGFSSEYYEAYHKVIPKAPGFNERKNLYTAFHLLNHWNHFGDGYKKSSLSALQACVKYVYG